MNSRLIRLALVVGLVAGVLIEVLTFLVARYGPSASDGAPWSFRGNGALVIPFGLGPAVLAGAWTAIVLHFRGSTRWLQLGIAAGVIGALLVLASAAVITLPGAAAGVSQALFLVLIIWTVAAPVAAAFVPTSGRRNSRGPWSHLVAAAGLTVSLVAGFGLASNVLPPGS